MAAQVSQAALAGNEPSGRHMRERPVGDVGEDLLDDGVVAVLPLGLDQFYLKPQLMRL